MRKSNKGGVINMEETVIPQSYAIPEEPTGKPANFQPSVSLQHFLDSTNTEYLEIKAGFKMTILRENPYSVSKTRDEWQKLFELYKTKPSKVSWATWVEKGGR